MHPHPSQSGFSLVELSIVLVILGLLTGGILGGQSLIRAAELRSLSTDASRYVAAVYTFRDKYFALPGDMANATAFWGAAPSCATQASSGTTTCNGNGDGQISWGNPNPERPEIHTFWQQLANAGLIEGSYDGVRGPGTFPASTAPGTNSPRTRISNGCWSAFSTTVTPTANLNATLGLNTIVAGTLAMSGGNPDYCHGNLIRPEEMWNIDTKLDDGRPGQGSVVSWNQVRSPNCSTTNDPTTAQYNLSDLTQSCAVLYLLR